MKSIKFGKNETLLSDEDYGRVLALKKTHTFSETKGYVRVQNRETKERIPLHRFVLGATDKEMFVDHINGNKMDNQRENLRMVTKSENSVHKTSTPKGKYRNVNKYLPRKDGTPIWVVQVRCKGKVYHGGTFTDRDLAAEAAKELRKKVMGEFA